MPKTYYPTAEDDEKAAAKAPAKPKATAGSYKWDLTGETPVLVGVNPDVWPWEDENLTPLERVEAEMKWIKDLLDDLGKAKEAEEKGESKPVIVVIAPPTFGELSARLTVLANQRDSLILDAQARKQNREVAKQKAKEEAEDKKG